MRLLTTLRVMPGMLSWFYFALGIAWGAEKATHQELDRGAGPRPYVAANQLKSATTNQKTVSVVEGGGILDKTQPRQDLWGGCIHIIWDCKLDDN